MPLRRTNRIPTKHFLSAKRRLPPLGLGFVAGIKGSTSSHSASGKSCVAIRNPLSSKDVLHYSGGCRAKHGFVRNSKEKPGIKPSRLISTGTVGEISPWHPIEGY